MDGLKTRAETAEETVEEIKDEKDAGCKEVHMRVDEQKAVQERQAAIMHSFKNRIVKLEQVNEEWQAWEYARQAWEAESEPSSSSAATATTATTATTGTDNGTTDNGSEYTIGTSVSGTTAATTATTSTDESSWVAPTDTDSWQ